MRIHPTAIVHDGAEIGPDVEIGPYCIVGAGARIGPGVRLISHVVIDSATTIGARTRIYPFAVIGGPPQHLAYKDEPTRVEIGADCIVREGANIHRGTIAGGGVTRIGDRCFIMSGAHVGHDCRLGNEVVLASNSGLGGHTTIEDCVFLGGLSAVHQHCRIGAYAFVGGGAALASDLIPFGSALGNRAYLGGLNIVGKKRRGLPRPTIHALRAAYRTLFQDEGAFEDRLARAEAEGGANPEVRRIIDFIKAGASRSLLSPAG
jgi:UDP-N-acetylglucosamine acyltransferase